MSSPLPPPSGDSPAPRPAPPTHLSARVPERVSKGVFSTGVVVVPGGAEVVLDFVQNLGGPPNVAARVVLPHVVLPQLIEALQKNLELYTGRFGPLPEPPRSDAGPRLTLQELYDELKIPDELLSGAYATGAMIVHGAAEFRIDFLTNLYPHSAVSSRVYLAAPQMPRILQSLRTTWKQLEARRRGDKPPEAGEPPAEPPAPPAL